MRRSVVLTTSSDRIRKDTDEECTSQTTRNWFEHLSVYLQPSNQFFYIHSIIEEDEFPSLDVFDFVNYNGGSDNIFAGVNDVFLRDPALCSENRDRIVALGPTDAPTVVARILRAYVDVLWFAPVRTQKQVPRRAQKQVGRTVVSAVQGIMR